MFEWRWGVFSGSELWASAFDGLLTQISSRIYIRDIEKIFLEVAHPISTKRASWHLDRMDSEDAGEAVTLHVYDLSGGMARMYSTMLLGKQVGISFLVEGCWQCCPCF
jgi:hypothetical protein